MLSTFAEWQNNGGITGLDGYSNYIGENPDDMLIMPTSHRRDSDALNHSNFAAALKILGGESATVRVHRFNHWAYGWYELILIDSADTERVAVAEELVARLQEEGLSRARFDESDFNDREQADANKMWRNCFDWRERIVYIREHPHQFEFCGFRDVLACARGEYFAGYAGELLA